MVDYDFAEIDYPGSAGFSEHDVVTVVEIPVCHAERYANVTRKSHHGGSFRSSVECAGSKRSTVSLG